MLLYDCPLSLLGLAYLMLLALLLGVQPPRGRWQEATRDAGASQGAGGRAGGGGGALPGVMRGGLASWLGEEAAGLGVAGVAVCACSRARCLPCDCIHVHRHGTPAADH